MVNYSLTMVFLVGLRHRRVRRWWKSPIRDEQVLLHLSHGQTVLVVLMTCCLRAACRQPSVITITKNGYYSEECLCRRPHSLFPQRSVPTDQGALNILLTQYFTPWGINLQMPWVWVNRATTRLAVANGSKDHRSSQR